MQQSARQLDSLVLGDDQVHWMEEETIARLGDMGLNLGVYTVPGASDDDGDDDSDDE